VSMYVHLVVGIFEFLSIGYQYAYSHQFGIYGVSQVGKTTLNNQLRTRGEVPNIKERTVGKSRTSRKIIKMHGHTKVMKSTDIGGETKYWDLWLQDIEKRKVKYVIFMIDDRHLTHKFNNEQLWAWEYLIKILTDNNWSNGKRKKNRDYPKHISIWANKYDLWKEKYEHDGPIEKHPIFLPFQSGLEQLQDRGVPCSKFIVSAKSDPDMVYRGIMTMFGGVTL
jgi:GTPase SAR1 family protein